MKTPSRRELEALPRQALHIARNNSKADVYKLEWPPGSGQFGVLKDMKARPAWFRLTAGRWFLAREFRALKTLDKIEGVPRVIARPDLDCLLMEWRAGTPVMDWKFGTVSPAALEEIGRIVAQSHELGVIHGDLHRSNVLLTPEEQVTIIDWATAGVFPRSRGALKSWTFAEWVTLDVRSVAKLKARHAPEVLSAHEKTILLHGSKIYRLIRRVGFWIRHKFGHQHAKSPEVAMQRYQEILEVVPETREEKP